MNEIDADYPELINLSADEQEQRLQLLKVEAIMTASVNKDNAIADGKEVNIVRVRFANMNEGSKPIALTYRIISGDAVFKENNSKSIRKNTNNTLSSTVELISTTPGKGTLTATPVLNPSMAPPPVDYVFVQPPRKLSLLLTVNTDNQHSDGVATNVVTAKLVDDGGNPIANERIDFDLSGVAQFTTGSSKLSVTTDASGTITLKITSNANADIAVKLKGTLLSTSAVHEVTINFKKKPVQPAKPKLIDFRLEGIVTTGISSEKAPCIVRAVAVFDENSPEDSYSVRFSQFGIVAGDPLGTIFALPGESTSGLNNATGRVVSLITSRTQTTTGFFVRGTTDISIFHRLPQAADTHITAELLDKNQNRIATSSNSVRVNFISGVVLPPPPPVSNKGKLVLSLREHPAWPRPRGWYTAVLNIRDVLGIGNSGQFMITSDDGMYNFRRVVNFTSNDYAANNPGSNNFVFSVGYKGSFDILINDLGGARPISTRPVTIRQNGNIVWSGNLNTDFLTVLEK